MKRALKYQQFTVNRMSKSLREINIKKKKKVFDIGGRYAEIKVVSRGSRSSWCGVTSFLLSRHKVVLRDVTLGRLSSHLVFSTPP